MAPEGNITILIHKCQFCSIYLLAIVDDIKVFIGSWNVGNTRPEIKTMRSWLPPTGYDLYFVGAQVHLFHISHGFLIIDSGNRREPIRIRSVTVTTRRQR